MGYYLFRNGIAVDGVRKLCGLHGKYIDYHLYLTNLFVPAIIAMVMALKDKKRIFTTDK
jgi:hypothetical protein